MSQILKQVKCPEWIYTVHTNNMWDFFSWKVTCFMFLFTTFHSDIVPPFTYRCHHSWRSSWGSSPWVCATPSSPSWPPRPARTWMSSWLCYWWWWCCQSFERSWLSQPAAAQNFSGFLLVISTIFSKFQAALFSIINPLSQNHLRFLFVSYF